MEALFKGVRGLLVRCEPTGEKLIANKTMGHTVWCCNGAFSVKSTCTLAYCKSCSERMQGLEEKKNKGNHGEPGVGVAGARTTEWAQW